MILPAKKLKLLISTRSTPFAGNVTLNTLIEQHGSVKQAPCIPVAVSPPAVLILDIVAGNVVTTYGLANVCVYAVEFEKRLMAKMAIKAKNEYDLTVKKFFMPL